MRFRYLTDPLFVACLITYVLNRWLLKPLIPSGFVHDHLNDLICIPFWVPIMLWIQRKLRLRPDDAPPRPMEVVIPLILWSWMFELWLPSTDWGGRYCVGDPVDVACYATGAAGAAGFWLVWYGAPGRFVGYNVRVLRSLTMTVRAVYSKGVFKPAAPVSIAEGTEVELTISSGTSATQPADIVQALRRIASLPREGPDDGFSGADHDSVLYPRETR